MIWLRNSDVTRAASSTEVITSDQNEYLIVQISASASSLTIENCTAGPLYRDTFILLINNFTSDKNGYYWCQIVVNGSVSQPSQYAWFYAADSSSCRQQNHFKQAAVPECAQFHRNIYTTSIITDLVSISVTPETSYPTYTTSMSTSIIKIMIYKTANQSFFNTYYILGTILSSTMTFTTTTGSTTTQAAQPEDVSNLNLAVIGSLAALVAILGAVVVLMVVLFISNQHKKKNEGKHNAIIICIVTVLFRAYTVKVEHMTLCTTQETIIRPLSLYIQ